MFVSRRHFCDHAHYARKNMADTNNSDGTVVTEDYVEALRRRIAVLEKKLLPQGGVSAVMPLSAAVRDLERKLDVLGGKEKSGHARALWEKTRQLENVVSPEYAQQLKMTDDVKLELLCGQVEQLKQFSDRMEEVLPYLGIRVFVLESRRLYRDASDSLTLFGTTTTPGAPAEGLCKLH